MSWIAKVAAHKKMIKYLKDYHGKVVSLSGAGARVAVPMLRKYRRKMAGLVFASSSDGSFFAAACLNAVRGLRG